MSEEAPKVTIRPPKNGEKTAAYGVYETGFPDFEMSFEGFSRSWDRCKISGDLEKLWKVAIVDEEVVGVAINLMLRNLGWGAIWEIAVDPKMRNQGIGTQIVEESEKTFLELNPAITHFAIAPKTHRTKAISFVEGLGYGIQSLILQLQGPADTTAAEFNLDVGIARLEHIPLFTYLEPDTYWGYRDRVTWEYTIRGGECYALSEPESNMVVGFTQIIPNQSTKGTTTVSFSYKEGYGRDVIKGAMCEVETEQVVFWIQDIHQEILDYLYAEGFERKDSEFLAKKRVMHDTG
ncbi:MAG: GNAT family N-acetyltransferase [Promethearchaeia archaeon]